MIKILQRNLSLLLLAVFLLAACAPRASLDATSWSLESYRNAEGEMQEALPESVVTADFQATQVSGMAGCNNYNGSYQSSGNSLEFGEIARTRQFCSTPLGIMEQENAYLQALQSVAEFDISGNTLEMSDDRGDVLLVFTRASGG
jgi:heat shock protein HslJ